MPPLALALLLHRNLPWLSGQGRAVINALVCDNGRVGSSQALCDRVGLRSRFQLNRLLHREGLPAYEELAGWVCVFYWMLRADASGDALRVLAREARMDPATCYRLVQRVTGMPWSLVRRAGTEQAVGWFVKRCAGAPQSPRTNDFATRLQPRPGSIRDSAAPAGASQPLPRRLPLGGGPYGVALRPPDFAYITRAHGAAIERLDLRTGEFVGSISVGCVPTCIAFDPSGARAYASVQFSDEIAVIDATRNVQIASLRLPGDPYPLLLSPRGNMLFVTTNEDRLYALCPQNGRIIASLALPATSHHLALHPSGTRLYVATREGGSVLEVDTTHLDVLRTFRLGGWPQGLAVSADGTRLFVANEKHGVDVVRLGSGNRIASLDFETGGISLALGPGDGFVYVGCAHDGTVRVLDASSFALVNTVVTGGRPREIRPDPSGKMVIVANEFGWVDLLPAGTAPFALPVPPLRATAPLAGMAS